MSKQHEVVNKLAEAWNLFMEIPYDEKHTCDYDEFCKAIHQAQNIMFAQLYISQNGSVNGQFCKHEFIAVGIHNVVGNQHAQCKHCGYKP